MAITLEQQPPTTDPQAAYAPIVYMVSSSLVSSDKFRFVCDVTIAGTRRARLKVLPNSNNIGVFRVDKIIAQYLEITTEDPANANESIWTVGLNDTADIITTSNGSNYLTVLIEFGEERATSAEADPTVTMDSTDYFVRVLPAARTYTGMGNVAWDEGGSYNSVAGDDIFLTDLRPISAGKRMLTTLPELGAVSAGTGTAGLAVLETDVTYEDYRSYGCLLDGTGFTMSGSYYLIIDVTNTSGTTTRYSYFTNSFGGVTPSSADTDAKRLQYFGLGPANLEESAINIGSDFTNKTVDFYEAFLSSSADPGNGSVIKSMPIRFNMVDADCMYSSDSLGSIMPRAGRFNKVTLAWQNSVGGYDYFSFTKRHDRTVKDVKRKSFTMLAGNYDSASASVDFVQKPWEGGKTITNVSARQEIRANTDIFDEGMLNYLEGLILSPRVYMMTYNEKTGGVPVVITDSSFLHKTNVNERGCYTVSVTFEFARERETVA